MSIRKHASRAFPPWRVLGWSQLTTKAANQNWSSYDRSLLGFLSNALDVSL